MNTYMRSLIVVLLLSGAAGGDTLGFVEQKFTDLHFEKGKWKRSLQLPCYSYEAEVEGATVQVLRYGMGNLVSFKGRHGSVVTVCGSVAVFDEGFETGGIVSNRTIEKQK